MVYFTPALTRDSTVYFIQRSTGRATHKFPTRSTSWALRLWGLRVKVCDPSPDERAILSLTRSQFCDKYPPCLSDPDKSNAKGHTHPAR